LLLGEFRGQTRDIGIAALTQIGLFLSLELLREIRGGGDAVFNVTANGTPPYAYLWRTNGVPIPSATNAFFTIAQPTPATGLAGCDVVVSDAFGSITSRVAGVTFSTNPPVIVDEPANQKYPMPLFTSEKYNCEVGRIRKDCALDNGLCFWVCGDQLLKGAAHLAHQRGSLRRLSQQRGEDNQRRKQRQHTRICHGLGRVEHIVLQRQPEGFAKMLNQPDHRGQGKE